MNTKSCIAASAAVLAASLVGCNNPPKSPEQQMSEAEKECQVWRSYVRTRPYGEVLEQCTRRLGADYCRQCLGG